MNHNTISTQPPETFDPFEQLENDASFAAAYNEADRDMSQKESESSQAETVTPTSLATKEAHRIVTMDIVPQSILSSPENPEHGKHHIEDGGVSAMDIIARVNAENTLLSDTSGNTNLPADELGRYDSRLSKGLDWIAEKMDGGKGRFENTVNRIDGLAYSIDEKSKLELATSAIRGIGRVALRELKTELRGVKSIAALAEQSGHKGVDTLSTLSNKVEDRGLIKDLKLLANKARKQWDKRHIKRDERFAYEEQTRRIDDMHVEAHQMNMDTAHQEALNDSGYMDMIHEEAIGDQDYQDKLHAEALNDSGYMDTLHTEAAEQYEVVKAERRAAVEKANRARAAKAARRAKWNNKFNRAKASIKNPGNTKIGGSIARFARNTKAYAKGVHAAGMESVRVVNSPTPNINKPAEATQNDYELAA